MTQPIPEQLVKVLAALAQSTRIRILATIGEAGEQGVAAGEIARAIRCPASTLSFHLKELSQAGVLEARTRGRYVIYSACPAVLADLARFIAGLGAAEPVVPRPRAAARRRTVPRRRAIDRLQMSMFGD